MVMFIVAFINLHSCVKITAVTECCNHFFIYSLPTQTSQADKGDNLLIVYISHFQYFEDIYIYVAWHRFCWEYLWCF